MHSYLPPRALTRIVPPALEPLTLADAKRYLRLDHIDEDMLILSLIQTAREAAENYLGRSLMPQQWQLSFPGALPEIIHLPMGPIQDIASLSVTTGGVAATIDPSRYQFDAASGTLLLPGSLIGGSFTLAYDTGYASAEAIPMPIRQGMLAHVAAIYSAREDGAGLPAASLAFYAPYREVRL